MVANGEAKKLFAVSQRHLGADNAFIAAAVVVVVIIIAAVAVSACAVVAAPWPHPPRAPSDDLPILMRRVPAVRYFAHLRHSASFHEEGGSASGGGSCKIPLPPHPVPDSPPEGSDTWAAAPMAGPPPGVSELSCVSKPSQAPVSHAGPPGASPPKSHSPLPTWPIAGLLLGLCSCPPIPHPVASLADPDPCRE